MRETLESIATEAGSAILAIYHSSDFNVEMKSDDSPLTRADLASHAVIVEALARHFSEIPVLSEEGSLPPFSERQSWSRYFLNFGFFMRKKKEAERKRNQEKRKNSVS